MVAPVRWATPGTEVDCAIQFWCSARATIQSTSTPPPWPPIASTAMVIGRFISGGHPMAGGAAALQGADHRGADLCENAVQTGGIFDDVRSVEGGAEDGGVGD